MFLQLFFSHLWSLLHGFFLGTIYNCNRSVYDLKTQCLRTWISIKMQAWKCLHLYSFKLQSITTEHHNYVADVIHNIYCQLHYFASHTLCYNLMLQSSLYSEILLFVVRHVSPMWERPWALMGTKKFGRMDKQTKVWNKAPGHTYRNTIIRCLLKPQMLQTS